MASTDKGGQKKQNKAIPSLMDQAHREVLDYLRVAEESSYAEIRATALTLAEETKKAAIELEKQRSKHQRKQEARVPPVLILWIDLALAVAVAIWCGYAYLHYPDRAARLSSTAVYLYLIFAAITLLLSGHLSQANFMKIFDWFKAGWNFLRGSGNEPSSSDTDDNSPK